MKKIKNLVILYPSYERGGATNNLINFMKFCLRKKYNIIFISNIRKKDFFFKKEKNIRLINLNNFIIFNNSTRFFTSFLSIVQLIPLLFKHNKKDTIFLSFQSHILPILFCKIFFKKIIIRNSEDSSDATKYADNKFKAFIALALKYMFYRFADGIITNSTKSKKSLQKIVKKNIKLIFNPYLSKIETSKSKKRKNIILSVGRLSKQKNQAIIIKAFKVFLKSFPNYRLIFIGHGNDLNKLKNLAISLKIMSKINFLGWIKNTKKYYLSSKLFVFPSLYEGLPNALIDSVNYNLPSISSRCSGAGDILGNSYKNFVDRDNYMQLSYAMVESIKNYSLHLSNLKKIKKNLNKFLIKQQSLKYLDYCEKILNKN